MVLAEISERYNLGRLQVHTNLEHLGLGNDGVVTVDAAAGLVVASAVAGLIAIPQLLRWYRRSGEPEKRCKSLREPASTLPVIGNLIDFIRHKDHRHDWLADLCEEFHGKPIRLRLPGRADAVIISTPEAVEDVLKLQFDKFPKGPVQQENFRDILGFGIFAVDGERWIHQRKTASNLFTARSLRESMTTVMRKHTVVLERILREAAEEGREVDMWRLLNRFTIEAFAEIGFGIEMGCLEDDIEHPFQRAFDSAQRMVAQRFQRPPWFWRLQRRLGVGAEGQLQRDLAVINETVMGLVAKCLAQRAAIVNADSSPVDRPGATRDLISLFLDRVDPSASVDPTYLRDIVVNFLIAGRDTTAQAMSWLLVCLSKHPEVTRKLCAELAEHLPGLVRGDLATPTLDDVQPLTYLEATIKETLRLYPSVPVIPKYVAEDTILRDGTFLRRGMILGIATYAMGRMPFVWGPDARVFRPERWIDATTGRLLQPPSSQFIAFNAGPRMCLGVNLAMLEMKIVLATLLARLEIAIVPGLTPIAYDNSVTLPIRGTLLARIRLRS